MSSAAIRKKNSLIKKIEYHWHNVPMFFLYGAQEKGKILFRNCCRGPVNHNDGVPWNNVIYSHYLYTFGRLADRRP